MHAWMDAQVDSYIIEVDKILLKDDSEDEFHLRLQSCIILKKIRRGMALHYTNVQMLADTCTDKPAHTLACGLRTRLGSFLMSLLYVTPKIVAFTNGPVI